jgi:hypothetical protein
VPNILQARAKDGSTGVALWEEMLKQIHAIEQHGGPSADQKQEFEHWLAGYLGVDIAPADPVTSDSMTSSDSTTIESTANGPTTTDPSATDPAATDSSATDSTATDPTANDSTTSGQ